MSALNKLGFLTQSYNLDMTTGNTPLVVNVSQHDTGRILRFTIVNSFGDMTIPTVLSAVVHGTKSDTTGFEYEVEAIEVSGSIVVSFAVTEQMTAAPGPAVCEIVITGNNNKQVATANFILMCEKTAMDDETLKSATDVYNLMQDIREQVQIATDAAEDADAIKSDITLLVQQAKDYAETASQAAEDAEDFATLAKSYAIGGTGTRTGENTDNSKYYSEQAGTSATNAQTAEATATAKATEASNSADRAMSATPEGYEDFVDNSLSVKGTADSTDLNNQKNAGIYLISDLSTVTHGPALTGSGYLFVVRRMTGNVGQLVQVFMNTDGNMAYYRKWKSNTWSEWAGMLYDDGDGTRY